MHIPVIKNITISIVHSRLHFFISRAGEMSENLQPAKKTDIVDRITAMVLNAYLTVVSESAV